MVNTNTLPTSKKLFGNLKQDIIFKAVYLSNLLIQYHSIPHDIVKYGDNDFSFMYLKYRHSYVKDVTMPEEHWRIISIVESSLLYGINLTKEQLVFLNEVYNELKKYPVITKMVDNA